MFTVPQTKHRREGNPLVNTHMEWFTVKYKWFLRARHFRVHCTRYMNSVTREKVNPRFALLFHCRFMSPFRFWFSIHLPLLTVDCKSLGAGLRELFLGLSAASTIIQLWFWKELSRRVHR